MSRLLSTAVGSLWVLTILASSAWAQKNPAAVNAALQARESMRVGHASSGTISGGYRPYSAWSYQSAAQSHAHALNAYVTNAPKASAAVTKEHVAEIQRAVGAASKEISKLSAEDAKKADVHERVAAIQKHYAEVEKQCGMLEKALAAGSGTPEIHACCLTIDKELKAAGEEQHKLLHDIGIPAPGAKDPHAAANDKK